MAPGLFIFWSGFSAADGHVQRLNTGLSDIQLFGLAAGDGGLRELRVSAGSRSLTYSHTDLHTMTIYSCSTHKIVYRLLDMSVEYVKK